jgi:hypothetical protein
MITDFELYEAKQVGILYHFTNLISLYYIVKSNTLNSIRTVDSCGNLWRTYNLENKSKWFYISFTRNKNLHKTVPAFNHPSTCRITINGDKLSNKYKIYPINYFKWHNEEDEECIIVQNNLKYLSDYVLKIEIPNLKEFKNELYYGLKYNFDTDLVVSYSTKLKKIFHDMELNFDRFKYNKDAYSEKLYNKIINEIKYDNYL